MKCPTCGAATRVRETREMMDGAVKRRQRVCPAGHVHETFEIDEGMFRAARHDIERKARAQPFHAEMRDRHARATEMRRDRLAGKSCREISEAYGVSVHMARYYTRLPRARLYPAAKRRDATLDA